MAKTNALAGRTAPLTDELLTLEVVGRSQVTPHMVRVTLGGEDAGKFVPLGFDQWFRLFIPVSDDSLRKVPAKLNTLSYLRFLTVSKTDRPVLRNYTVRDYRPAGSQGGAEIDVDFVVHGSVAEATSGPAAAWAQSCDVGDTVAIIDEGTLFALPDDADHFLVVVDESGLPAAAGIVGSLDDDAVGTVLIEIPSEDDRQHLEVPDGVEVRYLVREDPHEVPGRTALAAAQAFEFPGTSPYVFVAGEQALATGVRRHFVGEGVAKDRVSFTGYWRAGKP